MSPDLRAHLTDKYATHARVCIHTIDLWRGGEVISTYPTKLIAKFVVVGIRVCRSDHFSVFTRPKRAKSFFGKTMSAEFVQRVY